MELRHHQQMPSSSPFPYRIQCTALFLLQSSHTHEHSHCELGIVEMNRDF
jgi:hypothetical protein